MSLSERFRTLRVRRILAILREEFADWLAERIHELSVWRDVRAFPPLAMLAGVDCVAVLLVAQRTAAAESLKLGGTQLCVVATIAALLAIAARALLARIEPRRPAAYLRLALVFAAAFPIVALVLGSTRRLPIETIAYIGSLTPLVALAAWTWSRSFVERLLAAFYLPPAIGRSSHLPPDLVPLPPGFAELLPGSAPARQVSWLARTVLAGGDEQLNGSLVAEFAAGQALATLHVPFLPIFPRAPLLECRVAEGSPVRIKRTAVYPYGARLELKRTGDTSAASRSEVGVRAQFIQRSSRAA